jgi:Na+-driven multidrug efflux pump
VTSMGERDPEGSGDFVEIYGEYVKPLDLAIAFLVTIIGGAFFYMIAPTFLSFIGMPEATRTPLSITIGLIGASIGFLVTLLFVKPKRVIVEG